MPIFAQIVPLRLLGKTDIWLGMTFRLEKYELICFSFTSSEIPDTKKGLNFFRFRCTPTKPSVEVLDSISSQVSLGLSEDFDIN